MYFVYLQLIENIENFTVKQQVSLVSVQEALLLSVKRFNSGNLGEKKCNPIRIPMTLTLTSTAFDDRALGAGEDRINHFRLQAIIHHSATGFGHSVSSGTSCVYR
jgi:hypothetical protein